MNKGVRAAPGQLTEPKWTRKHAHPCHFHLSESSACSDFVGTTHFTATCWKTMIKCKPGCLQWGRGLGEGAGLLVAPRRWLKRSQAPKASTCSATLPSAPHTTRDSFPKELNLQFQDENSSAPSNLKSHPKQGKPETHVKIQPTNLGARPTELPPWVASKVTQNTCSWRAEGRRGWGCGREHRKQQNWWNG